jgi:lipoprotein-anchoring transpeptidase ErfK/SrfK
MRANQIIMKIYNLIRFAGEFFTTKILSGKMPIVLSLATVFVITSCVTPPVYPILPPATSEGVDLQNPYPIGTHQHFMAEPEYLRTSKTYKNYEVLERTNPENSSIVISLSTQRAILKNGEEVAMDYPVSTGTRAYPTPAGSYKIREMVEEKRSNQYGKIYDADGNVIDSNASMPQDKGKIPEGGKFVGASMPYWMRLTWAGIGMHVGKVPRYPASHACIRGQSHIVPIVYSKVKLHTPVTLVE